VSHFQTPYGDFASLFVHRTNKPLTRENAVAIEFTGSGDPARSMALLWRPTDTSAVRRGPRSSLDVDRIVAAAVRLADAEGLAAVSMRRVAGELSVPAMTLYSHVPGKGELVDLMLDGVLGELYPDEQATAAGNWRARVEAVARENRRFLLRHPWALSVGHPPPGPNRMRKQEIELRAVDGMGLSEMQMDLLVSLLDGFVRGAVGGAPSDAGKRQGAEVVEPYAQRVDPDRFPTVARVAAAAAEDLPAGVAADRAFEFGLERLLDGIGVLMLNPSR
jgi:AcrR family transcriptional regulator